MGEDTFTKRYFTIIIRIVFLLYCLLLIKVILIKYPLSMIEDILAEQHNIAFSDRMSASNFTLFNTIGYYIQGKPSWNIAIQNLVGNFVPFIPFGALLPASIKSCKPFFKAILCFVGFSLLIEVAQFFTYLGVFDVDDILLNTLGAITGLCVYKIGHILLLD